MSNKTSGIALNVSRARLTLLGFVLTINVFAIGNVLTFSGGAVSEQIILELNILVSLFGSVAIGSLSAVLFLVSERFDPKGESDVGIFAFAEMAMYIAVAQTLNGLFQEFLTLFVLNLDSFAANGAAGGMRDAGQLLELLAYWTAALAWGFVVYIAPVWSVTRLPTTANRKYMYIGFYLTALAFLFFLHAIAVRIAHLSVGLERGLLDVFIKQFWIPFLWRDLTTLAGG